MGNCMSSGRGKGAGQEGRPGDRVSTRPGPGGHICNRQFCLKSKVKYNQLFLLYSVKLSWIFCKFS